MPELPEAENIRLGILPHVKDQIIHDFVIRQPKLCLPMSREVLSTKGQKILDVERRAKYLLLKLVDGFIAIHLGLSGRLQIFSQPAPETKNDHIDLLLENGIVLRYSNSRRFGSLEWAPSINALTQLKGLGVEPLNDEFNGKYFYQMINKQDIPIKMLLMDKRIVVGIGNMYTCEALFMSRISPDRLGSSVTEAEAETIVDAVKQVLNKAMQYNKLTLNDTTVDDSAEFIAQLQVYGREGSPCLICQTPIESIKMLKLHCFCCPQCQK